MEIRHILHLWRLDYALLSLLQTDYGVAKRGAHALRILIEYLLRSLLCHVHGHVKTLSMATLCCVSSVTQVVWRVNSIVGSLSHTAFRNRPWLEQRFTVYLVNRYSIEVWVIPCTLCLHVKWWSGVRGCCCQWQHFLSFLLLLLKLNLLLHVSNLQCHKRIN